jgi:hypothetical protein
MKEEQNTNLDFSDLLIENADLTGDTVPKSGSGKLEAAMALASGSGWMTGLTGQS